MLLGDFILPANDDSREWSCETPFRCRDSYIPPLDSGRILEPFPMRFPQPGAMAKTESIATPSSGGLRRDLLESWLNGSGHSDDAWAEKLLGRKNTSLEA